MIDTPFRRVLPKWTGPLTKVYAAAGLSPNQVTILGFIFAVAAAICVGQGNLVPAVALWWVGRLFDGTDGIYAREKGLVSDFGGYLDIVVDMASYSAMILGFAMWKPDLSMLWLTILLLYVLCITSALALGAIETKRGAGRADDRTMRLAAGLAEGGETGIAYTLMLLLPDVTHPLAVLWIAVLSITVVARTHLAARVAKDPPVAAQ